MEEEGRGMRREGGAGGTQEELCCCLRYHVGPDKPRLVISLETSMLGA